MERSSTARPALGRLSSPLGLPFRRPATAPRRGGGAARRGVSRGLSGLDSVRALLALAWRRRATRIALLAVLVLPLLGGGYLALRHSSFVAVQRVHVVGVHGAEAPAIKGALESAARGMSTLDVRGGALRAAVAQFPVVRSLSATAQFPHGLSITVIERPAVAALVAGGVRTAVAADGVVLGQALLSPSLPTLGGWSAPAPGAHLHDYGLLAAVRVLGAAPSSLATRVARAYTSAQGLTLAMHNGLVVYFGDGVRPHAKWLSLARVLADPSSKGAIYIDVRVPGRPAAGFPAGAGPAIAQSGSEQQTGSESPVGALAEALSGPASSAHGTGEAGASAPEGATETGGASASEGAAAESARGPESAQTSGGEGGGTTSEAGAGAATTGPQGATEAPTPGG